MSYYLLMSSISLMSRLLAKTFFLHFLSTVLLLQPVCLAAPAPIGKVSSTPKHRPVGKTMPATQTSCAQLLEQAERLQNEQRYVESAALFDKAVPLTAGLPDASADKIRALLGQALAHTMPGSLDKAASCTASMTPRFSKLQSDELASVQANIFMILAAAYSKKDQFEKAERAIKDAIKLCETLTKKNDITKARLHVTLGNLYLDKGKIKEGLDHRNRSPGVDSAQGRQCRTNHIQSNRNTAGPR